MSERQEGGGRALLWIFLLGLVLRLGFLAAVEVSGRMEIAEGAIYRDLALNLLGGRGLSISEELLAPRPGAPPHVQEIQRRWSESGGLFGMVPPGRPTAFFTPLYPMFLAGLFALFGSGFFAARLAQLLLSALLPLVAFYVGQRAVDRRTGLAAALLAAVHPYFIYYAGLLVTQILFVVLLALTSAAYYGLRERPGAVRAALVGLLLGLSFLARTFALLFLPLLLLVLLVDLRGRRPLRLAAVLALAFAAVVSPWALRNRLVFGEFLLLPTNGGRNLWEYNNQQFSSEYELQNEWTRERYRRIREEELGRLQRLDTLEFPRFRPEQPEPERDRILSHNVRAFAAANPRVFFRLALVRAGEMLRVTPVRKDHPAFRAAAWLTLGWQLPLALLGMLLLARRWRAGPLYLYALTLSYLGFHALVASGTPHRVQVDLYLLVFCAWPLGRLAARLADWRRGGAPAQ